jgi:hypothetical protein
MSDSPPASPQKPESPTGLVGILARIAAVLTAAGVVLSQIPPVASGVKSAWCSISGCDAPAVLSQPAPDTTPAPQPTVAAQVAPAPPKGEFASVTNEALRHLAYELSQQIEAFRQPIGMKLYNISRDDKLSDEEKASRIEIGEKDLSDKFREKFMFRYTTLVKEMLSRDTISHSMSSFSPSIISDIHGYSFFLIMVARELPN